LQAGSILGSGGTVDFFPQNEAGAGAARVTRQDVLKDASRALGGVPTPDQLQVGHVGHRRRPQQTW